MKSAKISSKAVYFFSVVLAVLVMVTFMSQSSAIAAQQFTFGSSGIGGVSFVVGAGLTNIWNQDQKGKVIWTCETSGGSTQNIAWLGTGMLQAGLVSTDRTWGAKLGIGQFQKSGPLKVEKVRSFAVLYGNWLQPVVRADFKGDDVLDLFGKRVAVGQPGHASQAMLMAIAQTG
ncbi:MAG: TAXI family TRAP transporter solute-binding subunit, partial [bacterium]